MRDQAKALFLVIKLPTTADVTRCNMRMGSSALSILLPVTLALAACATGSRQIPTLQFSQYALDPGPSETQIKSDITISLRALRITDIYDHPELFSFDLDSLPEYSDNTYLNSAYQKDASGKQWEYWFASPDASEQLIICWIELENGTEHILRMEEARIYLIAEGRDPIPAVASFDELVGHAERFWEMGIEQAEARAGLFRIVPPPGFASAVLADKRTAFRLVNDVGREILPGFTFSGMLVFPVTPTTFGPVSVSFFDITTETDAAGDATARTRFDFALTPQAVQAWYDGTERRWKPGVPPAQVGR